jgi:hypothetical protein
MYCQQITTFFQNYRRHHSSGNNNRGTIDLKDKRRRRKPNKAQAYWHIRPDIIKPLIDAREAEHKRVKPHVKFNRVSVGCEEALALLNKEKDKGILRQVEFYCEHGYVEGEEPPKEDEEMSAEQLQM